MPRGRRINASSSGVQVKGLNELNRALRQVGPEAQKELKKANLEVAEMVAADAISKAKALGSVFAKVAPSIRATARNTAAGVGFGGAAYPFAEGAEFGSYRYKQFQPWRGSDSDAGYFIYPAIRDNVEKIETAYSRAMDDAIKKAGLK